MWLVASTHNNVRAMAHASARLRGAAGGVYLGVHFVDVLPAGSAGAAEGELDLIAWDVDTRRWRLVVITIATTGKRRVAPPSPPCRSASRQQI
jgi:hypothetical protein